MHPAYRGLFDYDALKQQSNGVYDNADAELRQAPDYGSFNNTMSLMHNQVSKQSPWSPYFQSLDNQGVSKVGQDAARPQGIADAPGWVQQGDVGALSGTGYHIPQQPLMDSNNIATPETLGLRRAGRR